MRWRGTLFVRPDSTLMFIACGTTTEWEVTALPESELMAAVVAVNQSVRDSIWVEFTADSSNAALTVRETLFATSLAEGSRCDRPAHRFAWEALGAEPFWRLTIDSTLLVLERPEPPLESVFNALPPDTRGALTTIRATRSLGKVQDVTVGLLHEACRDNMSDAWYPYRAEVRMGNEALHGCARR